MGYPIEACRKGGKKGSEREKEKARLREIEYLKDPKKCEECKKEFSYGQRHNKFCSRSCSAKSSDRKRKLLGPYHSEETKQKIRNSAKKAIKEDRWNIGGTKNTNRIYNTHKIEKFCKKCNSKFLVYPCKNYQQYCSKVCSYKELSKNLKGKSGGIRKGSGRSKSGYYQGIFCGSTYELAWVIYNLDHNIPFQRNNAGFEYEYEERTHKYYPDFVLNNGTYVEIKGYKRDNDQSKWDQFPHKLIVLNKEACQSYINYVAEKESIAKLELYKLYDDHKPKYNFKCSFCGMNFSREWDDFSKRKFCSRNCAGKISNKQIMAL